MKQIEVSLVVTTGSLTLAEVSSRLACSHSSGSHEKGAPRGRRPPFARTIWRLSPTAGSSQALEEQFKFVTSKLQADTLRTPGVLPEDSKVYFDIAVYFDSPMATLSIPLTCVDIARSYFADIEISCYPSDFASKETAKKKEKKTGRRQGRNTRRSGPHR